MKNHSRNRFLCTLTLLTGSPCRFKAWLNASLMSHLIADLQLVVYLCILGCVRAEELKTVKNLQESNHGCADLELRCLKSCF